MGNGQPQFPYPLQVPAYDLPGAEYFSLAPNRTIALQGRRRVVADSVLTSVPANTNGVVVTFLQTIESTFQLSSGIYVHRIQMAPFPNGAGLVLAGGGVGLTLQTPTAGTPDFSLGIPIVTLTSVALGGQPVLLDRDVFATGRDITFNKFPNTGNLSLTGAIAFNNPTAGAVTVTVDCKMIYTRLDGILE